MVMRRALGTSRRGGVITSGAGPITAGRVTLGTSRRVGMRASSSIRRDARMLSVAWYLLGLGVGVGVGLGAALPLPYPYPYPYR